MEAEGPHVRIVGFSRKGCTCERVEVSKGLFAVSQTTDGGWSEFMRQLVPWCRSREHEKTTQGER